MPSRCPACSKRAAFTGQGWKRTSAVILKYRSPQLAFAGSSCSLGPAFLDMHILQHVSSGTCTAATPPITSRSCSYPRLAHAPWQRGRGDGAR